MVAGDGTVRLYISDMEEDPVVAIHVEVDTVITVVTDLIIYLPSSSVQARL